VVFVRGWVSSRCWRVQEKRKGKRGHCHRHILELCSSWTKKTKIMYRASLSHQMLKFYLSHIDELGYKDLLTSLEESEGVEFRITEKGQGVPLALPQHDRPAGGP